MEIKIHNIKVGYLGTNCYVVSKDRKCVIIDPGGEPDKIISCIEKEGFVPEGILLTHGHFDHILGLQSVIEAYPSAKVYASEHEREVLSDPELNFSDGFSAKHRISITGFVPLTDGEELLLADICFKVIFTPGHTEGSCCYHIRDAKILFSGDTLFRCSYGRTDFPTGSMRDIRKSITEKLFALPDDTAVYPGHEEQTSIGFERIHNMILDD